MIQINKTDLKTAIQWALGSKGIWTPEIERELIIEITNLALSQHDVSRQSELLCDFLEWYDVDLTLEEREMQIKTYMDMKSHNCH